MDEINFEASETGNNPFAEKNNEELTPHKDSDKKHDKKEDKKDKETKKYKEEIEKLKTDYETLNNQYIRLAADFDNFRKRQAQERESLLKYGCEKLLKQILTVLDTIDRANPTIEQSEDVNVIKESYNVIIKQLLDTLQKEGLEQIKVRGEVFDPNLHDAVMQTPTEEYPENTIIEELQKGYMLGDRVLRAALVNVATNE